MELQFSITQDVWQRLQQESRPLVLYGTGNGAEKLLAVLEKYQISVSDIFVSDAFYRGQEFHGYTCLRYTDICQKYEDCIILIGFAIFRDDMIHTIKEIAKKYEVLAPEVPVFGYDVFTLNHLTTYQEEIQQIYNALADEQSRKVFSSVLHYRLTGQLSYLFNCETPRQEVFDNLIHPGDTATYVDLGAYRGDTIEEFLQVTGGRFQSIYALEPDTKNYQKLQEYLATLPKEISSRINTYPFASWSEQTTLPFDGGGGRNSSVNTGKREVQATDVDSVLKGIKATYIKMDVEGAEAETLTGLKQTLAVFKPALAVSTYHRTTDLFLLPLQILTLQPQYQLYLRHHPYIPAWETNYYCL